MTDIYSGALIMLSICSLLWIVGLKATQHRSKRLGNLVGAMVVLMIIAYIVFLWDQAVLTQYIPYSNVIVLGNFFPVGAAVLSGIACGRLREHRGRQAATAVGMLIAGAAGLWWPMFGRTPECGDKWQDTVCLQTSQSSCMAAASATLLRCYGVQTSEREMARLCFTRERGTNWLGLYHGLAVKLESSGLGPVLFEEDLKGLLSVDGPQIISCELTEAASNENPDLSQRLGMDRGGKTCGGLVTCGPRWFCHCWRSLERVRTLVDG